MPRISDNSVPTDEIIRWMCLLEGVEITAREAERRGIDVNKKTTWIKPSAFQRYIKERFPDVKHALENGLEVEEQVFPSEPIHVM